VKYSYVPKGVCSDLIEFDVEDGKLKNIKFSNGCEGNLRAVAILADGMDTGEAIAKLKGIDCEGRGTSCPDQFAGAIEGALGK
jgi:uncharacterized protein (TIGR03905 family)